MDYRDYKVGQTNNHFWFKARLELIDILVKKAFQNKPIQGLRILNLGAGTGDDLSILNKYGDNYVVDVDMEALALISDSACVEKKQADACALPYKDGFFDMVVSFDVFEHIEDDIRAVSEVQRVLKHKGVLVFTVPAFQILYSSHDKALAHYRRYNKRQLKRLFQHFNTQTMCYWNSVLFFPIALVRILKKPAKPKVDEGKVPSILNYVFYKFLSFDNMLIARNISPPLGISLVGWCRK